MVTISEIIERLPKYETQKRIKHSIRVKETALQLYKLWGGNKQVLVYAALLHDIARDLSIEKLIKIAEKNGYRIDKIEAENPIILHAPIGAIIAEKDFGITDKNILNCIKYHTTGRASITLNEAIIYLADFIEPGRDFEDAKKVRKIAFADLKEAVIRETILNVAYLMNARVPIHPKTIEMFNSLLKKELTKDEIKI